MDSWVYMCLSFTKIITQHVRTGRAMYNLGLFFEFTHDQFCAIYEEFSPGS